MIPKLPSGIGGWTQLIKSCAASERGAAGNPEGGRPPPVVESSCGSPARVGDRGGLGSGGHGNQQPVVSGPVVVMTL